MSFIAIIPARFASSRLPGKPLLDLAGKTMLQRVWEQTCLSAADRVVIATDDQRIADTATKFGAEVCMTSADHPSGTDRLQEVASKLGLAKTAHLVNVQGDEPMIPPALINQVAANLANNPTVSIATLSEKMTDVAAVFNPNNVKVVTDINGLALYFSRSPQPWARDYFLPNTAGDFKPEVLPKHINFQRHIGIYAYRVNFLDEYVTWQPAPLEQAEQLEQLRALWNGHKIHVAEACQQHPQGVDTPEDYQRLKALLAKSI